MEQMKKILWRLLFPPAFLLVFLLPISGLLLLYTFVSGNTEGVIAYLSYAVSFYTLTVFSARAPRMIAFCKELKNNNKLLRRYCSDRELRLSVSLYRGFFWNALYAGLQIYLGVTNGSAWFFTLAAYYVLLSLMRYFLLRGRRAAHVTGVHRVQTVGALLLPMNLVLAFRSFLMIAEGRGHEYHEIVTIALAAYTFYGISYAIYGAIHYRNARSPVMRAAKELRLVQAVISFLPLETAMLYAFGEGEILLRNTVIALTGAAAFVLASLAAFDMCFGVRKREARQKPEEATRENGKMTEEK